MITETIPESTWEIINKYRCLKLGDKEVVTPYYINEKRHKDLRAMVGKGTPEEIIIEARIWEKLKGADFKNMSSIDIKQFLISKGLGIDCSGFLVHVLNDLCKSRGKGSIWNHIVLPSKSFISSIKYKLKPVEHISADIMSNNENSDFIELKNVKPGDLIRSKGKKNNSEHIMLITDVERDETKENYPVIKLRYVHSSPYFGKDNGVKFGEIKITDLSKPLHEQEWLEIDESGVKHTLEGYLTNIEDNGIRRLKCLA